METEIVLSLVINTRNEEENIARCIKSAKDIVDEIVVVDMKSNDRTVEIAKNFEARVFSIKNYNYVEPARNYAIKKTKGKWILILDADEVLSKGLAKKILNIIQNNKYDVVNIPFKSILYDKWMKHTGWWPDYHPRLFKKNYLYCPPEIHAAPVAKGKILTLEPKEENSIIHFTTKTVSGSLEKIDRYSSMEKYPLNIKQMNIEDVVNYYQSEFAWRFIDQEGYKDGIRGFIFSKYMEFYRFVVFVKEWERRKYPELCSSQHLKNVVEGSGIKISDKVVINNQLKDLEKLRSDLNKIQNSKFYRLWQAYCKIRDSIIANIKGR